MHCLENKPRAGRHRLLSAGLLFVAAYMVLQTSAVALAEADAFGPFSDADTAALWLFDEPLNPPAEPVDEVTRWYYTQTLTDAGANYYDLHRLNSGSITPGRFGNALRIHADRAGAGMGLPTNYATVPRVYGVFLPADHEFVPGSAHEADSAMNFFWYTHPPEKLLQALAGDRWTVEAWVRVAAPFRNDVVLIDAGQGWDNALRIEITEGGRSARLIANGPGIDVRCDLAGERLSDGNWRHLAWVKTGGKDQVRFFVDGKPASTTTYQPRPRPEPVEGGPGLVAVTFADAVFDQPDRRGVRVNTIDGDWAKGQDGAWSIRMRGRVRAPHTGRVRFDSDADSGVHLSVGHTPLIYGWFGRCALYKRSPRWGEIEMVEGRLYPVLIECAFDPEQGMAYKPQQLYWSWEGHAREPVPADAWVHTPGDEAEVESDEGGGLDDLEGLMANRFNLTLGSDRHGRQALDGWIDEVRVSSAARYAGSFKPVSHAIQGETGAPLVATATGPALLFAGTGDDRVLPLGDRKHVFIDGAFIEQQEGVRFRVNPPGNPVAVEPDMPHGDHSVFDWGGKVALFAPAGYEGREDYAYLWLSDDGVHFEPYSRDSGDNSAGPRKPMVIDTGVPAWGRVAIDDNPNTPAWARFKFTAGVPHRGVYLLVSPDAIHWRRNETIMAQVGTGGETHWYWDDQIGRYRCLIKWDHGPGGRQSVEMDTDEPFTSWPLAKEGDPARDLATPLGYMPSRFPPDDDLGEVYRCRAQKYPWAADTYVAFIWRFDKKTQARQVELAVSRDGLAWTHYGRDWYMPAEFRFGDQMILEVTSVAGLIRSADEVWQYADYSTGRHDSSAPHTRVRLTQRLDGFVALSADDGPASFTTRPFVFAGDTLVLNVDTKAQGEVRVAVLTDSGRPIERFGLGDCRPVRGDSVEYRVGWGDGAKLGDLAGRPVRLRFQMRDSDLYALRFRAAE